MARKSALNIDALAALGAEKLARLVLDEAEQNAAFRKVVSAALASSKGPDAIAKIVDRRLSALERARSFIEWDKARAFEKDLSATVKVAAEELGQASPEMAIERLLTFIATHEKVFDRVDDSHGRVQDVYYTAIQVGRRSCIPSRRGAACSSSGKGQCTRLQEKDRRQWLISVDLAETALSRTHLPDRRCWHEWDSRTRRREKHGTGHVERAGREERERGRA